MQFSVFSSLNNATLAVPALSF